MLPSCTFKPSCGTSDTESISAHDQCLKLLTWFDNVESQGPQRTIPRAYWRVDNGSFTASRRKVGVRVGAKPFPGRELR